MTDIVQLGNEGFKLVVTVTDPDGTPRVLSGATNLKIKVKCALSVNGKIFTATAEDLPNGKVSYVFTTGDIDAQGLWKAQAYYELGTWKGHTELVDAFYVEGNLA